MEAILESDNELIERFVRLKDQEDFRLLTERHMPAIRGLLYSIFRGNVEDMEDAEQEILLSLFAKLEKFKFKSSFRTFLFRFARNKAIDMLRKKRSEKGKTEMLKSVAAEMKASDPIENLIRDQHKELVARAIASLEEKDRSLIIMRETGLCSIEECARVFGIPEGTVKSRLHAIRKKLYGILKEDIL
jgi:RNA polymerase sigma-70 factor, ECF subfamily